MLRIEDIIHTKSRSILDKILNKFLKLFFSANFLTTTNSLSSKTKKILNTAIILKIFILMFLASFMNCGDSLKILFDDQSIRRSTSSDTTPPNITVVSITSDNSNPAIAEVGDTIIITFTADEVINTPTVTILGNSATVTGGPTTFTGTYIVQDGDPIGVIPFVISDISDLAGNTAPDVTGTTDGSSVNNMGDITPPNIIYVSIASSNSNPTISETGNTITLTFFADEDIVTPTVTILGKSAVVSGGPQSFTATYVIQGSDPIGNVPFVISGIADIAGNTAPNVSGTTDFSNVYNAGTIGTPQSVINNPPADPSNDANLNVTISGEAVVSYQYKVVAATAPCTGGGYNGSWIPVVTKITNPIGPDGDYKLCVIGRNAINIDQPENMATSYTWTKGIYYWDLQVTTTSSSQNMTIQMDGPVNLTINWGDTIQQITTLTSITHTYASAGVYTLRIRGQASRIYFNNPDAQARLTRILSVVQGISGLTSFQETFSGCAQLRGSIPAGLFDNNTGVTSFGRTFSDCTQLGGSIPAGLFDNNTLVTTFTGTFFNCSGLTGPIPAGLFNNNTQVETFFGTFDYCTGLTGPIPAGLFANNTLVQNFYATFGYCSGLTGPIPAGLFTNNTLVTNFSGAFFSCSGLTGPIPAGLFANNTLVTNFSATFSSCSGLTGPIPAGLFNNNPLVTSFWETFYGCSGLTGIPSGLFNNNSLVTTFQSTFNACSGLTGPIPAGLFNNNTQVETFLGTFFNCSGLTGSIPAGLFNNNTQVETFYGTFGYCSGLTGSIPSGLFNNNTQVTNFRGTFIECHGLTGIPSGLFNNNTLVTNFELTFHWCTGITSAVPTLWISHPGTTHGLCFAGVTNASNYGAIPADWK